MARHPCGKCSTNVGNVKAVQCSICNRWYHYECANINEEMYKLIAATVASNKNHCWCCDYCQGAISAINKRVIAMEVRFKEVEDKLSTNTDKIDNVDSRVTTLEDEVKDLKDGNAVNTAVKHSQDTIFKELSDRESRKCNLVIHQIPEAPADMSRDDKITYDKTEIKKILSLCGLNVADDDVKFHRRLGEPNRNTDQDLRPVLVGFREEKLKNNVLTNASKLKESSRSEVQIGPDLTKQQRLEEKNLRDERDRLNAEMPAEEAGNWEWRLVGPKGLRKLVKGSKRRKRQRSGETATEFQAPPRQRIRSNRLGSSTPMQEA